MNARAVAKKRTSSSVVNIAGKAKDYAQGVGSLIVKDVKLLPGKISRIPSAFLRAVKSKIEINIIMPSEQPKRDKDSDIIES